MLSTMLGDEDGRVSLISVLHTCNSKHQYLDLVVFMEIQMLHYVSFAFRESKNESFRFFLQL